LQFGFSKNYLIHSLTNIHKYNYVEVYEIETRSRFVHNQTDIGPTRIHGTSYFEEHTILYV